MCGGGFRSPCSAYCKREALALGRQGRSSGVSALRKIAAVMAPGSSTPLRGYRNDAIRAATASQSTGGVRWHQDIRTAPATADAGRPMAVRTWLGV